MLLLGPRWLDAPWHVGSLGARRLHLAPNGEFESARQDDSLRACRAPAGGPLMRRRQDLKTLAALGNDEVREESASVAGIFAESEGTFSPIQALGTGGLT